MVVYVMDDVVDGRKTAASACETVPRIAPGKLGPALTAPRVQHIQEPTLLTYEYQLLYIVCGYARMPNLAPRKPARNGPRLHASLLLKPSSKITDFRGNLPPNLAYASNPVKNQLLALLLSLPVTPIAQG